MRRWFCTVTANFDRILDFPIVIAETKKNEVISIALYAQHRVQRTSELRSHVAKSLLKLFYNLPVARRVTSIGEPILAGRILVFDNKAIIN